MHQSKREYTSVHLKKLFGKALGFLRKSLNRIVDSVPDKPFHPGGGRVCSAQKRLWIPPLLDLGKGQHPHRTFFLGFSLWLEKAVDETETGQTPVPGVHKNDLVVPQKPKNSPHRRKKIACVWFTIPILGGVPANFMAISILLPSLDARKPAAEFFNSATGPDSPWQGGMAEGQKG